MFCEKCGSPLSDGATFCEKCGAKIENVELPTQVIREKKNISKKTIAIAAIILITISIIAIIANNVSKTVNLNDYLVVEFEGYDTVGHANVLFDKEAFEKDFGDKIKFNNPDDMSAFIEPIDLFWFYISGDLDNASNLTNGDTVEYVWNVDDATLAEKLNLKVKYDDMSFEVSGLEEVQTFDPFEGISLLYSGAAPDGNAELINKSTSQATEFLNYEMDKNNNLSNGDEITVSLTDGWGSDIVNYCINNYGMVPTATEKVFVVEGLGEYVNKIADISGDAFAQMQAQGVDVINSYVASYWDNKYEKINSITYAGSYLLLPKADIGYERNKLYLVYEINASDVYEEYGINQAFTFYFYVAYENIVKLPDETCLVDLLNYDTPYAEFSRKVQWGSKSYEYDNYYYHGYESLDELKINCITSQIDAYTYESTFEDNVQ